MRAYSKQTPPAVRILKYGNEAILRFFYDLREESSGFSYREVSMTVPFEEGLLKRIKGNEEAWREVAIAREQEEKAKEIRQRRDQLLRESDWTQMSDVPLGDAEKERWAQYRKALRDLPASDGFPEGVSFPELPGEGT